jgi:hypothetical protein
MGAENNTIQCKISMQRANNPKNGQIANADEEEDGIAGIGPSGMLPNPIQTWNVQKL